MLRLPPLSLYIHIPWCVQKCPYCDFNSHALKEGIPEVEYIDALLDDLDQELALVQGRVLTSIFIGGGTPSLLSPEQMARLLQGVKERIPCEADIEITMEANPGTVESGRFSAFEEAGITRISIGVQSFQQPKLTRLGRIHGPEQAVSAAKQASNLPLQSFNIDLMHGLPQQSLEDALYDLDEGIKLSPPHLSWYQLTIEPNTQFHSKPPTLPEDDTLADIFEHGRDKLFQAGYEQYEISAFSKPGFQCKHNLNYWRFGDYIGIGCGAHGKVTLPEKGEIVRRTKVKHPRGYLDPEKSYLFNSWSVDSDDLPLEYFMNRLRLMEACPRHEFTDRTGLGEAIIRPLLDEAINKKLLSETASHWQVTPLGHRFLNELLNIFM